MSDAPLALLGGRSAGAFLADYWQRRPLLVRAAWPGFEDPLSAEELAGLACEDDVSARLVRSPGAAAGWSVRYGPFGDDDFLTLPERDWTLLVQDVDKHEPDAARVLEPFRFLPDWRVDDLMISTAAAGGTVGPHWDDYDVFLLQGRGRRRWQLSDRPVTELRLADGDGLRLIDDFSADREWLLEPGDLLYLPPRVAHYGVAVEPCLTYSIGFRAPSQRELVGAFADHLAERLDDDAARRFGDAGRPPAAEPGLIDAADLEQIGALLRDGLRFDDDDIVDWFGRWLTEPALAFSAAPPDAVIDTAALRTYAARGGALRRAPGLRIGYARRGADTLLFGAGRRWRLPAAGAALAPLLCGQQRYDGAMLNDVLNDPAAAAALLALVNQGYLYNDNNDDDDDANDDDGYGYDNDNRREPR